MTLPPGLTPIYVDRTKPAAAVFQWQMADVRPAIQLVGDDGTTWTPQFDLLESSSRSPDFVLEVEDDGSTLRFGDGNYAAQAAAGVTYLARGPFQYGPPARNGYRVGNGTIGNVAAESIRHIVIADDAIGSVINPLPASGGVDPETIADVQQRAPAAFRTQERAVTPDDYATVAKQYPDPLSPQVRDAAATFRWTGSWYTAFLTVDRPNNQDVDQSFKDGLRAFFDRYRMAGQDVEIEGPLFVPLEIVLNVCIKPDYFQSDVTAALLDVFSDRVLPNGRKGVFHPDNFTFGQTIYLGPLYAAAQAVDGVASAQFTTFQRWGSPSTTALDEGKLVLHRTELARVSNDPSFPDHGVFTLNPSGGK
jgi:predicted phage baseplate assembly protein